MPTSSPQLITLIPARTSGGSIKNAANQIRYGGAQLKDPTLNGLFGAIAKALADIQSQVDGYGNALRQPIPLPEPIQISDNSGNLIAQFGFMLGTNNVSFSTIWAKTLYLGGTAPDTATVVFNVNPYLVNVTGDINITGVYRSNGNPGTGGSFFVAGSSGGPTTTQITFSGGIKI